MKFYKNTYKMKTKSGVKGITLTNDKRYKKWSKTKDKLRKVWAITKSIYESERIKREKIKKRK